MMRTYYYIAPYDHKIGRFDIRKGDWVGGTNPNKIQYLAEQVGLNGSLDGYGEGDGRGDMHVIDQTFFEGIHLNQIYKQ
jgi:hypothetical protein